MTRNQAAGKISSFVCFDVETKKVMCGAWISVHVSGI
jgi:hypothetical protein